MVEKSVKDSTEAEFYEEIDLIELFKKLWSSRLFILKATLIASLVSVLFSLSLTNYYRSNSILFISDSSSSLQSSFSQFGGLASLAGITLPSAGQDKSQLVIETIKSREFFRHLITYDDILPNIMASKGFDANSQKIIYDNTIFDEESRKWKKPWYRKLFSGRSPIPSYLEAHEEYLEIISASKDKITGHIYISAEHVSPIFAKNLVELIIREANTLLRNQDLKESSDALEYLSQEINKTSLIEIKDSVNDLIKAQLETQMIAKISDDYILKTIEPPYVPERKSKPDRAIISIIGTLLGMILSIIFIYIRNLDSHRE